ncbi:MAG: response regulator, partial [Balneolales bacterium]
INFFPEVSNVVEPQYCSTLYMKNILIVEDDMILSRLLETIVTHFGYEVVGKESTGKKAIKSTRELKPDIIIIDISLQGDLDGIETMNFIRTFYEVPFIYITGNSDHQTKIRAMETKPSCILFKPVGMTDLKNALLKTEVNESNSEVRS